MTKTTLTKNIKDILVKDGKEEQKSIMELVVKLAEEHGELAVAILQKAGLKSAKGKTVQQIHENILEEGCDIVLMVLSLLSKYDFSFTEFEQMLDLKLSKWRKQINLRKGKK